MAVAPVIERPTLGVIPDKLALPDLIEIQTKSYSDSVSYTHLRAHET